MTDPALQNTKIAYASRTNKKDWATTCMRLLTIGGEEDQTLEEVSEYQLYTNVVGPPLPSMQTQKEPHSD
jgi:hypothetical protein